MAKESGKVGIPMLDESDWSFSRFRKPLSVSVVCMKPLHRKGSVPCGAKQILERSGWEE